MKTALTRRTLLARTGAAGAGLALAGTLAPLVAPGPAASAPGQARDSLVIGIGGDASFINPVVASDGQSYKVEWPVFDGLVEYDETLAIRPLLAEKWQVSPDRQSYTFQLRSDVV